MKRLLIIGASILQLPAIRCAKELGYYVGVADYDNKAIGIPYADEYFNVSTIDIEGITKTAREFKPDGIMTLGTDMPMRAIAVATTDLGLPGISYDTAIKATDKGEMIKTFEKHGIDSPWYYIIKDEDELKAISDKLTYPCIIKPTDNAGSRGVDLVYNPEELTKAYRFSKAYSRNGAVILEEYMQGCEVSVEIVCIDESPHILAVTDKLTTSAPNFIEIGHTQHSQLDNKSLESIKELAIEAVKAVGIQNGPAHVEIMLTDKGPKMIELGARMGGGCIASHLVPLSTGIDMIKTTILLACNEKEKVDIIPKFHKGSAMRCITATHGRLMKINGLEEAFKVEGIKDILVSKSEGDILSEVNDNTSRLVYVISQADTAQEAIKICEDAIDKITIDISRCEELEHRGNS